MAGCLRVEVSAGSCSGSKSSSEMIRTRGRIDVEGRHVVLEVEQRDVEAGQLAADELAEREQPQPAAVVQRPSWGGEVAVVAAQHHVGVVALQRLEGALDADVDDLLVGAAGQRDRAVAHRQQRLDERQRHLAVGGVEEEQPDGRLAPGRLGERGQPLPARPLLGLRAALERGASPRVASMFSPSTRRNVRRSAQSRQPPATAGRTTTWSPSATGASRPPRKRTSSSLT